MLGNRLKLEIIAYDPAFFAGKGRNVDYLTGTMAKIMLASGDFVFEDSALITDKLGHKLAADITMCKPVALGLNTTVYSMAKVGDKVEINSELMNFTQSFGDITTNKFLKDLTAAIGSDQAKEVGSQQVLSKYSGTITDINIYYNVDLNQLSPSLQKIIKEYNANINKRRDELIAKGIPPASIRLKTTDKVSLDKINGTEFPSGGGAIIEFYITHLDTMRAGDKATFSIALKGVVSHVSSDDKAPFSEYRGEKESILAATSSSGVLGRMTTEIYINMYANKLLIETARQVHDIWNDKK